MSNANIDPRTGRPFGDHGKGEDAIKYALNLADHWEMRDFLEGWQMGDLEEWPDYYEWLKKTESARTEAMVA